MKIIAMTKKIILSPDSMLFNGFLFISFSCTLSSVIFNGFVLLTNH